MSPIYFIIVKILMLYLGFIFYSIYYTILEYPATSLPPSPPPLYEELHND